MNGNNNDENDNNNVSDWINLTQEAVKQLDPKIRVYDTYWKHGTRSDGRIFTVTRPYTIQHGIMNNNNSSTCIGSAMVHHGNNIVLASVHVQIGQPSTITPKQGDVIISVIDNTTMSTSNINIIEIQSYLQRIYSECINLNQLIIIEGKIAYRLDIVVTILDNSSGSMKDTCITAITAALLDTKINPKPTIINDIVYLDNNNDNNYNNNNNNMIPLEMNIIPCSLSAIGVQQQLTTLEYNKKDSLSFQWILDPDIDEELVPNISLITIVVNAASATKDNNIKEEILNIELSSTTNNNYNNNNNNTSSSPTMLNMIQSSNLAVMIHMAIGHAKSLLPILLQSSNKTEN